MVFSEFSFRARLINVLLVAWLATGAPLVAAAQDAPKLTVKRLYDDPGLSGPSPRSLRFSPDGSLVTFLQGKEEDETWQAHCDL